MTSRLLLDTCAIIWTALEEPLDRVAVEAMRSASEAEVPISVSPISAWELGLLATRGRLPTARSPQSMFEDVEGTKGVRVEPLTPSILIESSFLPGNLHSDPADRIIVATARAHALTVVTRDRAILNYARQGYVLALPC